MAQKAGIVLEAQRAVSGPTSYDEEERVIFRVGFGFCRLACRLIRKHKRHVSKLADEFERRGRPGSSDITKGSDVESFLV